MSKGKCYFSKCLPDASKDCLHNTALGKAYLASLPDDKLATKIESLALISKTEKTIVDKATLLEEVTISGERGFSLSLEEYLEGLLAIGAPLIDPVTGQGGGAISLDF